MSNDPYGENYDICFKDGDFASKSSFAAWNKRWEPENTSHEWVPESRKNDGTGCLRIIHSARPSTASHISQVIHLVKNARYKFSGYIKFVEITSTTANGNGGAYCTLGDAYIGKYTVQDLPYSADWTYFESFYTATYTGDHTFSCKLWGCLGTAYFDDLSVELVEKVDSEVLKHWTADGAIKAPSNGFTVVAVGDPQALVSDDVHNGTSTYCDSYRDLILKKDDWNFEYIINVGDLTDVSVETKQWDLSYKGHKMFEDAGIKYALALGNHDYQGFVGLRAGEMIERNTENFRNTYKFSEYVKWLGSDDFGSFDGTMLNTFHKFERDGYKYMIVSLENSPTKEAVAWAKDLCDKNCDRHVIFVTHCFINPTYGCELWNEQDGHFTDSVNSSYMWENLVSKCPNIFLACCGHFAVHGISVLYERGDSGNMITAVCVNPQCTLGGSEMMTAFLHIENGTHVTCYTYSPSVGKFYAGSNFDFKALHEDMLKGDTLYLPEGFRGKLFEHTVLDGAKDTYEYTSSDENVLRISGDGTVEAVSKGDALFDCLIPTGQSAYALKLYGGRIRVKFKVKVI